MTPKLIRSVFLMVAAILLSYTVYRDIRYGRPFSYDLRNRIVGARLEKDGRLPYFYKWKKEDGIRYYDPQNFDSLTVSNITASPLFHQLLIPMAEWDQETIKGWWLFIEYGMLVIMIVMALSMASTDRQRRAVLLVAGLFLLTDAWKYHIFRGQNYLCIPLLSMACYFFIRQRPTTFRALMAGIMAALLVGIRPNAIFFILPFFFLFRTSGRRYWMVFLIPLLIGTAWTMIDKNERALWQDYQLSMGQHIKEHQDLHPALQINDPSPNYPRWEGVDIPALDSAELDNSMNRHSENGNFFVLYNNFFHRKISPPLLITASLGLIFLLTVLFWFHRVRKGGADPVAVTILGYCLYMISDLFSPVHRHQYYTVQWIFPLLLAASLIPPRWRASFGLMMAGLLLNISKIGFIRMQHTIGEYLILAALVLLAFSYRQTDIEVAGRPSAR